MYITLDWLVQIADILYNTLGGVVGGIAYFVLISFCNKE